jgi:hypothetical protein
MKRKVLSFSIIFMAMIFSVNAQISVIRADFPEIGNLVVNAIDNTTTVNPGQAGANQTWDFGNLVTSGYDSTYYLSPAGNPGYQNYPDANLVTSHNPQQFPNGYNINYWNYSSTAIQGIADESLVNLFGDYYWAFHIRYLPPSSNLDFPIDYGDSKIQDFVMEWITATRFAGVVVDSAKTVSHINLNCLVDAWGTMILPDGSFPVIRVKEVFNTIDSSFTWSGGTWVYVSDTVSNWTQYRWYANDYGEVGFYSEGSKKGDGFTFFKSETLVGTGTLTKQEEFSIYPNPVSSVMKTNSGERFEQIEILDLAGRSVMQEENNTDINVSELAPGSYFVIFRNGKNTITKKFIKR